MLTLAPTPTPTSGDGSARPAPALDASPFSPRIRHFSRILMLVLAVVFVAEATALVGTYLLYSRYHVATDNAIVDADAIDVNAPATGTMRRWTGTEGVVMRQGESLGRVVPAGRGRGPERLIRAPEAGTVVLDDVREGEYVEAGQTLAIAYDLGRVWITARVDESDISRVRVGEPADIGIDAIPGVKMTGVVILVQASAAGQFSVYPSTDADPTNVQRIDQYIPVRIALTSTGGSMLLPGMNATVDIRTSR